MGFRYYIGITLIKLSQWLRRLIIIILPPKDIVNLAKLSWRRNADNYRNEDLIRSGLNEFEKEILEKHLQNRKAKILILGCGGGRESIALAKLGFNVVGVDMVEEMISIAKENSAKEKVMIDFICEEFSHLLLPKDSFDYAFFSLWIYGEIPAAKTRIKILKSLRSILKVKGKAILHFRLANPSSVEKKLYPFHKALAWIISGNTGYQLGDRIVPSTRFLHSFATKEEVHDELVKAGFSTIELTIFNKGWAGYAVANKN